MFPIYPAGTLELFVDGVSIGSDSYNGGPIGIDTDGVSVMAIGCALSNVDGSFAGTQRLDGYIDNFRVSSSILYTDTFTPPTDLYDRTDTLFLLTEELADDVIPDLGDDEYFVTQRGGVAVVESKNPLTIRVVDYQGAAWDGTVDLVVRGLPKIVSSAAGVSKVT